MPKYKATQPYKESYLLMVANEMAIHLIVDSKFLHKAEKIALTRNYDLCLVFNETAPIYLSDLIEDNWEEW